MVKANPFQFGTCRRQVVKFLVDAGLAVCGLAVSALFVGGRISGERLRPLLHRRRARG